jgi:hypothetical protein
MAWMAALLCSPLAIADPGDSVTGHFHGLGSQGGYIDANFSCFGTPTCVGTATGIAQNAGCLNTTPVKSQQITIQGLDLSKFGSLSLNVTLEHDYNDNQTDPSKPIVCTYVEQGSFSINFPATWTASGGTFSGVITTPGGNPGTVTGTFTAKLAAASPVFPMLVDGSVTPTTTDVDAAIQPRPQDVGKSESIYVFVHAPSNLVSGAKRVGPGSPVNATKDDTVVCVLAQVDSSGHLVAVSASTMKAYLTGVLTSQTQAVQVLNNVPTANVAGAAVYVGYGASAQDMLSSGVYQAAISVPGGVQCTASLASAPAPQTPGALTGLWWNESESGWGIHFTQRGGAIFAAWYTYDAAGNPKWYVASDCAGMTGTSGTCTGDLYQISGPTFLGVNFVPVTSSQIGVAGSFKATFTDANNGSITYTVGSLTRTIPIVRQPIAVGTATPAVDYTDLWWNPNESGWGMAMAQQSANIFLAWFVYDNSGKPVWYVASNCAVSGSGCSGKLYSTTGPPLGPTFDTNQIKVNEVGSIIVSFIDANTAVISYTIGAVTATKAIQRQLF